MVAASASASRKNTITGILVSALNRDLLVKTLTDQKIEFSPEDSTEALSTSLWATFNEVSKEDLFRCDRCGGISTEDLDECPYCGHDSGVPLVEAKETPEAPKAQETKAPEAQPMTTTQTNGHAEKEGKTTKITHRKAANPQASEAELDTSVQKIHELKSEGAAALWKVGQEVNRVYEGQLWKLRMNRDDAKKERPRWASFEAFCNEEIGMSPQNARNLMDVAKHYSEGDVRKFGTTKLGLILQAPPEDRAGLKEKVKKGTSKRELAKEVAAAKSKKNYVRKSRSGDSRAKGSKAGQKASAKSRSAGTLTVAKVLGTSTVKLYEKPASMKGVDAESISKLTRAKKIGDGCVGVVELTNDVAEWFTVFQTPAGELALKVTRVRDE